MFRQMRRKNQQIPADECEFILKVVTSGVLALEGDDGYPYAVPLSYVYDGEKIYFHCAKEGHKIDAIKRNCKASFCVIERDDVNPEEYTTYYKSVVVFGKIEFVDDVETIKHIVTRLCYKFTSDEEYIKKEIDMHLHRTLLMRLNVEHISGKTVTES